MDDGVFGYCLRRHTFRRMTLKWSSKLCSASSGVSSLGSLKFEVIMESLTFLKSETFRVVELTDSFRTVTTVLLISVANIGSGSYVATDVEIISWGVILSENYPRSLFLKLL